VTSGDPNFHLGTNYYLNVYQTNSGSSSSAVKYTQSKKVQILANGITQKFIFDVTYKRVRFFAIQVPVSSSLTHKVQINITGLDSQSFYPGLYLNQHQSSSAVSDFTKLKFATVQDFQLKLGDELKDVFSETVSILYVNNCVFSKFTRSMAHVS
jgi:hypothetical protein